MPQLRYRDVPLPPEGTFAASPGTFVREVLSGAFWVKSLGNDSTGWLRLGTSDGLTNVLSFIPNALHAPILDGTDTTDLTDYINNAWLEGATGLYFPGGATAVYHVSGDGITPPSGSRIFGHATIRSLSPLSRAFTLGAKDSSSTPITDVTIEGLTLDGAGLGTFGNSERITASAGQTEFDLSITYEVGRTFPNVGLRVWHVAGGVATELERDTDYVETDESTVTLTAPATDGDEYVFSNQDHGWFGHDTAIFMMHVGNIRLVDLVIKDWTNMGISMPSPTITDYHNHDIWIVNPHITNIGGRNTDVNTPYSKVHSTGKPINAGEGIMIAIGDSSLRADASASNATNSGVFILNPRLSGNYQTQISLGATEKYAIMFPQCSDTDSNFIQISTGSWDGLVFGGILTDCTALNDPTVEGRGLSYHPSTSGSEKNHLVIGTIIQRSGLYGLDIRAENVVVHGVHIYETGLNNNTASADSIADVAVWSDGSGCRLSGGMSDGGAGNGIMVSAGSTDVTDVDIDGFTVKGAARQGFIARTTSTGRVKNMLTRGVTVYGAGADGFRISATEDSDFLDIRSTDAAERGCAVGANCSNVRVGGTSRFEGSGTTDLTVAAGLPDIFIGPEVQFGTDDIDSGINRFLMTTTPVTLTHGDFQKYKTVNSNSGTRAVTLPEARPGMSMIFQADADSITISTPSGDFWLAGSGSVVANTSQAVRVVAIDFGIWAYELLD